MRVRTAQLREKERPRHRQFAPCACRGRYDDGPCTDRDAPEEKTSRPFRILVGWRYFIAIVISRAST